MKRKIYCGIVIAHLVCNLYGASENQNAEKLENPDTSFIINIATTTQLDTVHDQTIKRNQTVQHVCPAPYSIQNFIDLYGPFTMAAPDNGQILDFTRNNITSLYGLQNITNHDVIAVRLIGNCITGNTVDESFPDTPFQGLPNTIEIRLAQNHIESLPSTFLSGLDHLAYITLGNNQLSNFPDNFFSGHDLIYLGIANNKFSSLDSIDISNMPSLRHFTIENNNITSISTDYFKNNPALTSIYLTANSLIEWPDTALNSTSYLQELNLSYNALTDFSPDYISEGAIISLTGNPIPLSIQDEIQSKYPTIYFIF